MDGSCYVDLDRRNAPSKKVQELRDELDRRAGGTPAVVASPFAGLMLPRVSEKDGSLRTVALLNVRIDAQERVNLVLRGVPEGAKAVWRELRRAPVDVPLVRGADSVSAVIPRIDAWNAGYLDIRKEQ